MTNNLKAMIWFGFIILLFNQVMVWHDEFEKIQPEAERVKNFRGQELNQLSKINWNKLDSETIEAQKSWLERLPDVEQVGVFRAKTMESLGEICDFYQAGCRITAQGEVIVIDEKKESGAALLNQVGVPGLVYSNFRISIPASFKKLDLLMQSIEHEKDFRVIERMTARGTIVDLYVRSYGMNRESKNSIIKTKK